MKKNVIKMLLVAASVLALSGCGMAKAPTLDELKEGYASKPASNLEATVNLTAEGEFELTDVSDEVQELLDMLESQMDIDLNDGASAKLEIEMKLDGNNSEEASRMEGEMNVDFECSIDMIEDAFLEGIGDDDTIEYGTYIDKEEGVKYSLKQDGTWVSSDYDEDDDDDEEDITDGLGKLVDVFVAHNDGVDEKDAIKVVAEDGEYVVKYDFTLDNDYISNMSKAEKKELNSIIDLADVDFDIDDIEAFYEEYGEYAEIAFPLSLELRFVDNGEKKDNREFYISGFSFSMEGNVSVDLSADEVTDIVTEFAGDPGAELCGVEAEASVKIEISGTIGYDGDEEVSIPKDVTKNAVPEDEYEGDVAGIDDLVGEIDVDDLTVEDPDDDPVVAEAPATSTASTDGLYTLVDYEGMDIYTFAVPEGWEFAYDDVDAEDTYYMLNSDANSLMTIKCSVPSDILPYFDDSYEMDDDSSVEYVGIVKTPHNSYGYDVFYNSTWDEYTAVLYGDEFTSMVIVVENGVKPEFESSDDFEDFLKANF